MNLEKIKSLAPAAGQMPARHPHICAVAALAVMAALLFGRCLWSTAWIISEPGTDGINFAAPMYLLAHEGFAQGGVSAWSPYIYGGTPVMAGSQAATLYPVHWLCALLPHPLAMNWMAFLHVCLAGAGAYAWAFFRGLRPTAAFVAGVVFMLGGGFLARLQFGIVFMVMAAAWTPFVFLGIDGWLRGRRRRWIVLAAAAAAAQIYTGGQQFFYYTALTAGLYSLSELFFADKKIRGAAGLLCIYPLALALAAAQFLPTLLLVPDSFRAAGLNFFDCMVGAMKPVDLALLLAPGLTGGKSSVYWNNFGLIEALPYCGASALLLAAPALAGMSWPRRCQWGCLLAFLIMAALGNNTPLYGFLYEHVPGFAGFRAPGRLLLCFPLFLGLLAGMGFQRVADGWKPSRKFLCIDGFAACGLAAAGLWLAAATGAVGAYRWLAKATALRVEALGCPDWLVNLNRSFVARADVDALQVPAQQVSGGALLAAALWLALCGASLWLAWCRRRCAPLLALVVAVELFIFAWPLAGRFPSSERQYPEVAAFLQKQKIDDGRVLFVFDGFDNNRNSSITLRAEGLWGWCSLALKRYAEFVAVSQGIDPDKVNMDMPVWRNSRMFQLLRGRYAFVPVKGGGMSVAPLQDARDVLPRFLVVPRHRVLTGRDEILRALSAPDFDFRREVILESDPHLPAPAVKMDNAAPVPEYKIKVLSSSASRWTVEVTASVPGVLLMTDSHAKGWRATALPGSVQREYDLQPADWAVRGIPLTVAGTHFIEIKYTPPGLALGAGITALTLVSLLAAALAERVRRRLAQTPRTAGAAGAGESL